VIRVVVCQEVVLTSEVLKPEAIHLQRYFESDELAGHVFCKERIMLALKAGCRPSRVCMVQGDGFGMLAAT
jgi:hypothetical protein